MITQKYVEFILEYLGETSRAQLDEPLEDGAFASWKLGPTVSIPVKIKVLNKYTRSVNLLLSFDKYEVEYLFFMPINSSPDSILHKTHRKIEKIVNKTLIDDGRADEIKKMYADKRAEISKLFISAKVKAVEIKPNNSDKIVE